MMSQSTATLLMIRPASFRMNEQTAVNNYYQKVIDGLSAEKVNDLAREEFDEFVDKLRSKGVQVVVVDDEKEPDTPDAVFPNNWISFHEDGRVGLYPMFAPNRRAERREDDVLDRISNEAGLRVEEIIDFTEFEEHDKFLEGTGSMVLDRENKIAYAALSQRTDEKAFEHFCEEFAYQPCIFHAYQTDGDSRKPIYHTNVMMAIGSNLAILCADCVDDAKEKEMLIETITKSNKEIIFISEDQVNRFAGNMLEVKNDEGDCFLVMSESAFKSLNDNQIEVIEKHCPIIHSSLDTIEACGGGSARCMMAEVFLPKI